MTTTSKRNLKILIRAWQESQNSLLVMKNLYYSTSDELKEVIAENAKLRADRDRMNWLCKAKGSAWVYKHLYSHRCISRVAIDSARKEK